MKRTFQCAFAAALLLASSSAWAQTFGEKGQIAISAERLFGLTYSSQGVDDQDENDSVTSVSLLTSPLIGGGGGGWGGYGTPRVAGDYFIIDRLSLGAALGYAHTSFKVPGPGNTSVTTSGDTFTFAPRVGYVLTFSDLVGFWPRAGFTYRTFSGKNPAGIETGTSNLALTLEAPFVFTPIPHVVFWAGPTLDLGLTGSLSDEAGGVKVSRDFNATEFGIQTGLLVYFGT